MKIIKPGFIIGIFILSILIVIQSFKGPQTGAQIATAVYTTGGGRILKNGTPIQLKGVVWFGSDVNGAFLSDGLHHVHRNSIYDSVTAAGLNAMRIQFCPETLKNVTVASYLYAAQPDFVQNGVAKGSLDALDTILNDLNSRGIYIVLAHNRPDCANNNTISESWTTATYTEAMWINDLTFVAQRYSNLEYFVGIDIKNEPHGNLSTYNVTWGQGNAATDWDQAAGRAGAAVLSVNPNILIFVEGIGENATGPNSCSSPGGHWWGGNFQPITCFAMPTTQIPANKLVLSPHVYGPDVGAQMSYFNLTQNPNFPANMPAIWDDHFGHLVGRGYTVIPAGWGGKYGNGGDARDVALQNALVAYFKQQGICSSFFWALNHVDPQTNGLLNATWDTLVQNKVTLLQSYFNNCTTNPVVATSTPAPTATPTPTPLPPTPTPKTCGSCTFLNPYLCTAVSLGSTDCSQANLALTPPAGLYSCTNCNVATPTPTITPTPLPTTPPGATNTPIVPFCPAPVVPTIIGVISRYKTTATTENISFNWEPLSTALTVVVAVEENAGVFPYEHNGTDGFHLSSISNKVGVPVRVSISSKNNCGAVTGQTDIMVGPATVIATSAPVATVTPSQYKGLSPALLAGGGFLIFIVVIAMMLHV